MTLAIRDKLATPTLPRTIRFTNRRPFFQLLHKARTLKHYRKLERRAILLGMIYVFLVMREDFELADCIRRRAR